ncbi:ricin-type beta-trefoil lectin domain protein [Streptomyces sp. NPDC006285]|uniref:RICIN domain-containing protein n=1 Tax=Streptomyces sp. NPDC006285 TaxID=3364742 RepID=UPI003696712A
MLIKKISAVSAAALLGWGLNLTPANAAPAYYHLRNNATLNCLDYRADYGPLPYATQCNEGGYQTWLMNDTIGQLDAMRQNAGSRLCLVARNGQAAMKPCSSSDPAALWSETYTGAGFQVMNNVTKTCLGEQPPDTNGIRHVNLTRCTGGASQQWILYR